MCFISVSGEQRIGSFVDRKNKLNLVLNLEEAKRRERALHGIGIVLERGLDEIGRVAAGKNCFHF
jgi:hypothetical protein